jgi:GTP-binding protein Era
MTSAPTGPAGPSGSAAPAEFRSGFVCIVGRPNAGKSTLTNAIVGQKVAITSGRPQTTRHVIRGVVHRPDAQLVLVDTPGLHRPRTLLGERLNDLVMATLGEVDAVAFCLPADQKVGPGDRYIAQQLAVLADARVRTPVVAVATKADLVQPARLAEHLMDVAALGDWSDVVPVSATSGYQVTTLVDVLVGQLSPGPALYPDGELTDEPEAVMVAELVREAALEGVRDELPHSLAVVVEEIVPRAGRDGSDGRPALLDVRVELYVERPSQKAIIIGRGGSRLREIGTTSRRGIEALLGAQVNLDLHVRVAKDWQRDPKQLGRLGF